MELMQKFAWGGGIALLLLVGLFLLGWARDAWANRQAEAYEASERAAHEAAARKRLRAASQPQALVIPASPLRRPDKAGQPAPADTPAPASQPTPLERWLAFDELSWQAAKMAEDAAVIQAVYETMSGGIVSRCQWAQAKLQVSATDLVEAAANAILSQTHGDWNAHKALVAAS